MVPRIPYSDHDWPLCASCDVETVLRSVVPDMEGGERHTFRCPLCAASQQRLSVPIHALHLKPM